VVVIEKDKPGGVCLNVGCIPSKALIHQAEIFHHLADLEAIGVKTDTSAFDYAKVFKKSRAAATKLSKGVQFLLKKNNVEFVNGEARLTGPNEVTVDGSKKLTGKYILLATGSRPKEIPAFPFDEKRILSSTGALMQEDLPKSLLILGAGAIGVEFAYVMSAFGVEVHLVEMLPQILPLEDEEVVDVLEKAFKKQGIQMMTGTKASSMKEVKAGFAVTLEASDGKTSVLEVERILVAVGRAPNTENIGLEEVGVELDRGFVKVGDYYQSTVPSVFAIGDITPSPLLAHVASKEGEIAVEHMAGHAPVPRIDPSSIPGAVYSEPQIGSFGFTEKRAKEEGVAYEKATFPYRGAGKSVAVEQPEGLVKILTDPKTTEIIGAHVVGANATELIHELLLARTAELLPEDIATMIHAHPTLSEAVMESARASEGWVIHA
jgi:dihydrolipoamide dehydrogenase